MSPALKASLESNIWKHCLNLCTNKRTYLSIFGVYLMMSTGSTEQAIGLTVFIGSIAGVLMEMPSGFIADRIGHKKGLIIARIFLLISTALYLIGGNLIFFILGSIFLSLGQAFTSGTGIALMHETLTALERDHEYTKIMGRIRGIAFAIPALLTMILPFLVSIHIKLPFAIALLIDFIGLAISFSYTTPPVHVDIKEVGSKKFKQVIAEAKKLGVFRYLMFMGIVGGALSATLSFSDAYQSFLSVPIIYYGLFWGLGQGVVALLLILNHHLSDLFTFHQFLLLRIVSTVLVLIMLALFAVPWVVVVTFIFVVILHRGLGEVQTHYLLNMIKSSKYKATLLSFRALFGIIVTGTSALCIGTMIKQFGYQIAFGSYAFVVLLVLGSWLYWIHKESKRSSYSSRQRIEKFQSL